MNSSKIIITGIVQGVGFRPFIYNLARDLQLTGYVQNDSHGVTIVVQGASQKIARFAEIIQNSPPSHSRIERFETAEFITAEKFIDFKIAASRAESQKSARIAPDLDVCPDCRREMFDPGDRRYLYPFINCTNCGPRFTIIQDVPYDRPLTTMREFQMCPECQREYDDPQHRRFHAQPNACPVCGPRLQLLDNQGRELLTGGSAAANHAVFEKITELLHAGKILAVKGIGGFHLACDARNDEAVTTLRRRKYREDKPFAVMFAYLADIAEYCEVSGEETRLLISTPHPIVLLRKSSGRDIAPAVAPGNHYLGCFLPYTPLHYLLMHFFPHPLVLTSGNLSDEPIAYRNDDALTRLSAIADYFLLHNRKIHIRCDDSVDRIATGRRRYPLRRARGYAPSSIPVRVPFVKPLLACGPEQKNTFALAKNDRVYLSQHIGDLVNYEVLHSLETGVSHFKNLFDIEPEVVAYDLHPDYLSTKYALAYPTRTPSGHPVIKIGVQHHHAHAVACLAENNVDEPALAIVLDGTGYGVDGTIWGGEILRVEAQIFERLGHLRPARLPGGAAAIKNPWQMALSYLYETFGVEIPTRKLPFLQKIPSDQIAIVLNLLKSGFNSPLTTSCGRLFDGVAALAGLRNQVNYEGQAAVEFEQCIDAENSVAYDFEIETENDRFSIDWRKMIRQVVEDIERKVELSLIAMKFHNGLAHILLQAALRSCELTGLSIVALSGGVFMNIYLLTRLSRLLEEQQFKVLTHQLTPCNDGGIALGQGVIANAIIQNQAE
ncbi:MAG: carbamoyltransferase HypF [Candidatus Marinimicrobia bacterium]|jgi:hydrogenase maturation protein HypF|nr:carbamoyltransferase HypF [Candidatus Neomarinimicrobiota bacterium]